VDEVEATVVAPRWPSTSSCRQDPSSRRRPVKGVTTCCTTPTTSWAATILTVVEGHARGDAAQGHDRLTASRTSVLATRPAATTTTAASTPTRSAVGQRRRHCRPGPRSRSGGAEAPPSGRASPTRPMSFTPPPPSPRGSPPCHSPSRFVTAPSRGRPIGANCNGSSTKRASSSAADVRDRARSGRWAATSRCRSRRTGEVQRLWTTGRWAMASNRTCRNDSIVSAR
jgi:hypothetical protein